jgi:hypothetical protein
MRGESLFLLAPRLQCPVVNCGTTPPCCVNATHADNIKKKSRKRTRRQQMLDSFAFRNWGLRFRLIADLVSPVLGATKPDCSEDWGST